MNVSFSFPLLYDPTFHSFTPTPTRRLPSPSIGAELVSQQRRKLLRRSRQLAPPPPRPLLPPALLALPPSSVIPSSLLHTLHFSSQPCLAPPSLPPPHLRRPYTPPLPWIRTLNPWVLRTETAPPNWGLVMVSTLLIAATNSLQEW